MSISPHGSQSFLLQGLQLSNSSKLGDITQARQAVNVTSELGSVPGIPALCQAMISGVKAQLGSIAELEALEKEGLGAMR